ncbi:MAG: TIGR02466 family protein [Paracoccaceae bacterium]
MDRAVTEADEAAGDARLARGVEAMTTMAFPTPITLHEWPESAALNARLREIVLGMERESAGVARSNVGGWHSGTGLLRRDDPAIGRLVTRIKTITRAMTAVMMKAPNPRMSLEGWANVLRAGQYNGVHVHPNSTWSGVYYVTGNPKPEDGAGDPAYSGRIEFLDPRPGAAASYTVESVMQRRCLIDPPAGAMVVFPSWLPHQVHPYFGPGERISIAFNMLLVRA